MDITGIGSIFEFGTTIIDKLFPNADDAAKAKLAMLQLQQAGEFKELEANLELAKGQMEVNKAEASSGNKFASSWRPLIGYICGIALFYNYIFMPLFAYCAGWIGNAPAMPALDSGELMTLLLGMLGISGLRTAEKVKGVASK